MVALVANSPGLSFYIWCLVFELILIFKTMIIAMVSDFFFPKIGGVESHIIHLSHQLIRLGHTIIVITHHYPGYVGIHYIGCLKVYYLPLPIVYEGCTFPTILCNTTILGKIFYEEDVDLVHGHQSSSALALEACIHASLMGIKSTFTDHSLFSFKLNGPIFLNKCCKFALRSTQAFFCVSQVSSTNLCLRSWIPKDKCYVIPNAIVNKDFTPDVQKCTVNDIITIVVVSRLVYRKGTDLLIKVIPIICQSFKNVHFLIAGEGEKQIELEQMIDQYLLFDRVTLLGGIALGKVRNVLVQGSIFLNTSLTEAFCIAILEAASCGLLVVSTNVGGIPEVLPSDMVRLSDPNSKSLIYHLELAIKDVLTHRQTKKLNCFPEFHDRLCKIYSWEDVAIQTAAVYQSLPEPLSLNEMIDGHTNKSIFSIVSLLTLVGSWMFTQLFMAFLDKKKTVVKHLKYENNEFYFDCYIKHNGYYSQILEVKTGDNV
eukprot:NODE_51_length_27121_cov_0.309452.p5 type:complete len:485 gc:universal NODE_51_length_27121_cov_0.309452:11451-12905(+)